MEIEKNMLPQIFKGTHFSFFIEGRVTRMRHAFPPTGIIFLLLGLDIKVDKPGTHEKDSLMHVNAAPETAKRADSGDET